MENWQVFAILAVAAVVGAVLINWGQAPDAAFEIHSDQTRYDAPATITVTDTSVAVEEAVDILYPSWSPDGRYLVCQKREPGGWTLVVYEVADADGNLKRGAVVDLTTRS